MLSVGSLFSGAGLLDAGLSQAGVEHAWFVERDESRRALLGRRWPGRPVHDDVRTVGAHNLEPVDCIVGGFPCKGASTAGKRTGLAHPETALWAEFYRIVGELRPRYVVIENVANLLAIHDGAVWGTVLGDLASLGFAVAWDCVPAAAFGAPHGRDRVVAIAADASRHGEGGAGEDAWADWQRTWAGTDASPDTHGAGREGHGGTGRVRPQVAGATADGAQVAADAEREPSELRRGSGAVRGAATDAEGAPRERQRDRATAGPGGEAPADTAGEGGQGARHGGQALVGVAPDRGVPVEWGEYEPAIRRWEAVHGPAPEPLVRRMDDGLPNVRRMRSRVDRSRLSALGDGVHVYLGRLVGEALMELDRSRPSAPPSIPASERLSPKGHIQ